MERYREIEKSITEEYKETIWEPFLEGVKRYELINDGDRVCVCISGGKDSMLTAKLTEELKRRNIIDFEAEYLVMDPGYNAINRQTIENNAKLLNIPIHIFETDIFDSVANVIDHPCYLCARMRRGYLYNEAQKLGCNKIALGHHFDDVIETILMGMLYGAQVQTMMPKLHSTNHPGMELIRPMYMVKEAEIISWARHNGLQFIQCACRFTENCTLCDNGGGGSKRQEMKTLIKSFRKINPEIEMNIFKSVENVDLNSIIGFHDNDGKYNFMDDYDV